MAIKSPADLDSDELKVSYGFGLQFGDQLLRNQFEGMDLEAVIAGITHWYEHQEALLADEDINPSFQRIQEKQKAAAAEAAGQRAQLADEFLRTNAEREDVTVTDSGLQYEVLESGEGDSPQLTDTVVTHYHGTFVDGAVFDSSVERGEPAQFGVNQVIPGWTEALQMMKPGDKWRITCPPHLAYGEQGAGNAIPPNTSLVFEIHLINVLD